jgi:hypothetical protein
MDNEVMFRYQTHLLRANHETEQERQRDKRYCDGSMQRYLEERWCQEDETTKEQLIRVATTR